MYSHTYLQCFNSISVLVIMVKLNFAKYPVVVIPFKNHITNINLDLECRKLRFNSISE